MPAHASASVTERHGLVAAHRGYLRPISEWTRLEVIADGSHLLYKVNGAVVNEAFEAKPDSGKLILQAEMFIRRYELWPLGEAPEDELKQ